MGNKIFVSYKYGDANVHQINGDPNTTARNYVDRLMDIFEGDEIYKGEGDEDLSEFKDDPIKNRLKDKIHDSSITIVLISPCMKENNKRENDQWIPWEISYSLKEIVRNDKTSHTNGIITVVLPDISDSYTYYIEDNTFDYCNCRKLRTNSLFQILRDNMFNIKEPLYSDCPHHEKNTVFTGQHSYISSIKWVDFIKDKDSYIETAKDIRDGRKKYTITKEIKDERSKNKTFRVCSEYHY